MASNPSSLSNVQAPLPHTCPTSRASRGGDWNRTALTALRVSAGRERSFGSHRAAQRERSFGWSITLLTAAPMPAIMPGSSSWGAQGSPKGREGSRFLAESCIQLGLALRGHAEDRTGQGVATGLRTIAAGATGRPPQSEGKWRLGYSQAVTLWEPC